MAALCVECDAELNIGGRMRIGQRIFCPNCGVELEVISTRPLEVDIAVDDGEGWDDDDPLDDDDDELEDFGRLEGADLDDDLEDDLDDELDNWDEGDFADDLEDDLDALDEIDRDLDALR